MNLPGSRRDGLFIIAEAGVNHNGSRELALELVRVAAASGAHAVKFQTFRAELLALEGAPKAAYQRQGAARDESQYEMLKRLELSAEDHHVLSQACHQAGIEFMSTPFDEASVDLLVREIGVKKLKLSSGDLTNGPLLLKMGRAHRALLISTGMAELSEVQDALSVLAFALTCGNEPDGSQQLQEAFHSTIGQEALQTFVTLLHCTSAYPAPADSANLRAMETLAKEFRLPVGYSDHTTGNHVAAAAVARGACIVEKHFTLDRKMAGPDHMASLDPDELSAFVRQLKEVSSALGDGIKQLTAAEAANREIGRRSIVAAEAVQQGQRLSAKIAAKRPGVGLSPILWWDVQRMLANRDYGADEIIDVELLHAHRNGHAG